MRRVYFLVAGLIIGMIITGFFFSSVSRSGEQGDYFYTLLKNAKYETILGLIDKDALNEQSEDHWLNIFKSHTRDWGNLVSYKNTGFHTETVNGICITHLDYEVLCSKGNIKERIDFVKRGSKYKILDYVYRPMNLEFVSNK